MFNFRVLAFLLVSLPAFAVWTFNSSRSATAACSGSSCSITVPSTTSGDTGVIMVATDSTTQSTISSISGGGTGTIPTGCAAVDSSAGGVALAFIPALSSGVTSITVNLNNSPGAWTIDFRDYTSSGGSVTQDGSCGASSLSSCTSCVAPAATGLSGTSDVVVSNINPFNSITAASSPCGNFVEIAPNNNGVADHLNTSSGTGCTMTQSSAGTASADTIALKEAAGAISCGDFRTLMGAGCK